MIYSVSFQHPDCGLPCRAKVVAGRLSIEVYATDPDRDCPQGMPREEFVQVVEDAEASCKKIAGRYKSLDAAGDALERFGVDLFSEGGWEQER